MSLADRDKVVGTDAARRFVDAGFSIAATAGTADALHAAGIPVATRVAKVGEPTGTDAVELISSGKVDLVVNSPRGRGARADGAHIRTAASVHGIPCLTTAAAGLAAANGIVDRAAHELRVRTLQEFHAGVDLDRPTLDLVIEPEVR
jgi:carbamoyl-phosphate synthase large subunit